MRGSRTIAAATLALALAGVACGGDDTAADGVDAPSVAADTSETADGVGSASGDGGDAVQAGATLTADQLCERISLDDVATATGVTFGFQEVRFGTACSFGEEGYEADDPSGGGIAIAFYTDDPVQAQADFEDGALSSAVVENSEVADGTVVTTSTDAADGSRLVRVSYVAADGSMGFEIYLTDTTGWLADGHDAIVPALVELVVGATAS